MAGFEGGRSSVSAQMSSDTHALSWSDDTVTTLSSACMKCGAEGTTTFLLRSIPHFREVILSSFECLSCAEKNNSVQFGGAIQQKGTRYALTVSNVQVCSYYLA